MTLEFSDSVTAKALKNKDLTCRVASDASFFGFKPSHHMTADSLAGTLVPGSVIFKSMFGRIFRPLAGLILLAILSARMNARTVPAPAPVVAGPVVVLRLHGIIEPVTVEYIRHGLAYARRRHAAAVVLELNTPGGLEHSMRQIIEAIFASPMPVIGYVGPSGARAASAGFFILESCDLAAMAPGTNTGASHPVVLGGPQPKGIEAQKMQNDAAAYMRAIASRRGRNVPLAVSAVVKSASFTDQEALQGHLINLIAANRSNLLRKISGLTLHRLNGAVVRLQPGQVLIWHRSWREKALGLDPGWAFLLLIAGVGCLFLEFTHPGAVVPGVCGVLLITWAVFQLSIFPISWAAAAWIILGLALFAVEAKFPAHGIWAIGGGIALTLGAVFLISTPIPAMRIGWAEAGGLAAGLGIVMVGVLRAVLRSRHAKRLSGVEAMAGKLGVARTDLAPMGIVTVAGENWQALARQPVAAGASVRIRAVHGLQLDVEPLSEKQDSDTFAQATALEPPKE